MNYITTDILLLQQLSSLNLVKVDPPVLSYDSLKKQVIYSFIGRNQLLDEFLIEIRIKRLDLYRLEEINVYSPQTTIPPPLVLTDFGSIAIAANNTLEGTIVVASQSNLPQIQSVPTELLTVEASTGQTIFNLSLAPIFLPQNLPNTVFLL